MGPRQGWEFALWFFLRIACFLAKKSESLSSHIHFFYFSPLTGTVWFSDKNERFALKKSELRFHKEWIALVLEKKKRAIRSFCSRHSWLKREKSKKSERAKSKRVKEQIPNPMPRWSFLKKKLSKISWICPFKERFGIELSTQKCNEQ